MFPVYALLALLFVMVVSGWCRSYRWQCNHCGRVDEAIERLDGRINTTHYLIDVTNSSRAKPVRFDDEMESGSQPIVSALNSSVVAPAIFDALGLSTNGVRRAVITLEAGRQVRYILDQSPRLRQKPTEEKPDPQGGGQIAEGISP